MIVPWLVSRPAGFKPPTVSTDPDPHVEVRVNAARSGT